MLRIKCPKCEKALGVKDELAGKRVACPQCKAPFTVPKAAAPVAGNGAPAPAPANGAPAPAKEASPRIPFTCPSCQLKLKIPAELAGRQKPCPKCKTPISIPKLEELKALAAAHVADGSAGGGVDLDDLAATALAGPEAKVDTPKDPEKIDFTCPWCDEQVQFPFELSGKQEPCPKCKRIVKVPKVERKDPTNWREKEIRGPSLAVGNQPKKLDDAWEGGTRRVSAESLQDADAVPVITEPLPEGTWARRVMIFFALIVVVGGGFWIARNLQVIERNKKSLKMALVSLGQVQDKMPRGWVALVNLGAGECQLQGEYPNPHEAKEFFKNARVLFLVNPAKKNALSPEEELLLVDMVQMQILLGGDEELVIYKKRLNWADVQKELERTVSSIKTDEGKLLALRKLSLKALELKEAGKGQLQLDPVAIALGLATQINAGAGAGPGTKSILLAEQVALLVYQKKTDVAQKLVPAPKGNEPSLSFLARLAYAQANAYEGNFDEAKNLALYKGQAQGQAMDRFHTLLAIADIALAKNKKDEAKILVEEARKIANDDLKTAKVPPLLMTQFVSLATRLELSEPLEDFLKRIPDPGARANAQLNILKLQAAKENKPLDPTTIENQSSVAYAQALLSGARQKAQAGNEGEVLPLIEIQPEINRPILYIGVALGTKE